MRKFLYVAFLALWAIPGVNAQDIHYSQFGYAPATTNPGLTGIFRGKFRAISNSRQQWRTVPVNYLTFSASADVKLPNRNQMKNGFWAVGASFNYDRAGLARLQNTNLNFNLSYTHRLAEKVFITAGAQSGIARRDFDINPLLFNSQYDPTTSSGNPDLPPNEIFQNFENDFADFSAGINLRIQDFSNCEIVNTLKNRSSIDIGVGVFHLNRPDQAFNEVRGPRAELPMRISPYILANKQVDPIVENLTDNFSLRSLTVATIYFPVVTIMYGIFPWLLGRSALKKGNEQGKVLMKRSVIIPVSFIGVQILASIVY